MQRYVRKIGQGCKELGMPVNHGVIHCLAQLNSSAAFTESMYGIQNINVKKLAR